MLKLGGPVSAAFLEWLKSNLEAVFNMMVGECTKLYVSFNALQSMVDPTTRGLCVHAFKQGQIEQSRRRKVCTEHGHCFHVILS